MIPVTCNPVPDDVQFELISTSRGRVNRSAAA